MSQLLNEKAYETKPDNLIYDSKHPIDVTVVNMNSGNGVVKRGTVLSLTSDEKYVVLGSTLVSGVTAKANCIVAEDVDTGSNTGNNVAVEVYTSGHFNANALTVAESYTMTKGNKEELRTCGIFVDAANEK